jgi:hypothetical protein
MKKIFLIFVILIMVSGTVQAANIGNWNGSGRSWNDAQFSAVKSMMIAAGHNVEPDGPITAGALSNDDVFVIGEAWTPLQSEAEMQALFDWTVSGGILLILSDSGNDLSVVNLLLAQIVADLRLSPAAPLVAPFPSGVCATDGPPFNIVGQTLATTGGNSVLSGIAIAGDFIHYQSFNDGMLFVFGDRSDHNTFAPSNTNTNGQLFLNLAKCIRGSDQWPMVYEDLSDPTSDNLGLMRAYRDDVLSTTAIGRFYKYVLYQSSEKALDVLLDNPEMVAQLKVLIDANIDAVRNVLSGNGGVISNTAEVVAFLDTYASNAPLVLNLLARLVKWNMIIKQRWGGLFFGFRLK